MFLKRNINKLVLISSGNHTRAVGRSRTYALTMPRDVTRTLIGGGGRECLFTYSCSARRISFEFELISKEIRRA